MTTIAGSVSPSPQVSASAQMSPAEISTQTASGKTGSLTSSSALASTTSASYSDASQAAVSLILDQQDGATSVSDSSTAQTSGSSQPSAAPAARSAGGGSSSSSTKTVTENEPDGEVIALTEDESGKVISEKVVKAASQTETSTSAGNSATKSIA